MISNMITKLTRRLRGQARKPTLRRRQHRLHLEVLEGREQPSVTYQSVFSQPPNPAGGLIASSFLSPNGMDGDGYAYDSFSFATNKAITEITWRGGDMFNGLY